MKHLSEHVPILSLPSHKSNPSLELTWNPDARLQDLNSVWKKAIYLSVASFVISIVLCVAGIVCASLRSSASTAAFAADCLLDALTSVIVFWRYYRALRGHETREQQACTYLGILLLVSAIAIIVKAVADVISQPEVGDTEWLLWLSSSAAIAFFSASIAKYWLFRCLRDESLLMDAVNTFLSALFCMVVAITVFVIDDRPDLWYLDPVEGGIFALFMGMYGVKCIVDNTCLTERDLEKSSYHSIPIVTRSAHRIHM